MATDVDLEDAHVLFMDVVGYSRERPRQSHWRWQELAAEKKP
jgi:hypothetical protein